MAGISDSGESYGLTLWVKLDSMALRVVVMLGVLLCRLSLKTAWLTILSASLDTVLVKLTRRLLAYRWLANLVVDITLLMQFLTWWPRNRGRTVCWRCRRAVLLVASRFLFSRGWATRRFRSPWARWLPAMNML